MGYFYLVKYIAISFHINSCGRVFNIKMYNIEMLLQNGFEDINFIMKFWKDNSKCQNFSPFKLEMITFHKNNYGRNIRTFHNCKYVIALTKIISIGEGYNSMKRLENTLYH